MSKKKSPKGLWTKAEVNLLKKLFPNNSTPIIATKFGRKKNAVENKARRMGLRKSKSYLKSIGRYKRMEDRRAFLLKSKKGFCDCPKADCLLFLTCPGPSCNTIVLQCSKTGIIFPNPKEPYHVDIRDFGTCPNCDCGPIDAYSCANYEDILNLGFKKEDLVGVY